MKRSSRTFATAWALVSVVTCTLVLGIWRGLPGAELEGRAPRFARTVHFKMKQGTGQEFSAACRRQLSDLEGCVLVCIGTPASWMDGDKAKGKGEAKHRNEARNKNETKNENKTRNKTKNRNENKIKNEGKDEDERYNLELRIVFESEAALERFRKGPRWRAFKREIRSTWSRRRIFDGVVGEHGSAAERAGDLLAPGISKRFLRVAAEGESRENAIPELEAAGESAVPPLLEFLHRHGGKEVFGLPRAVHSYDGAVRALIPFLGLSGTVAKILERPQILRAAALGELKRRSLEVPAEELKPVRASLAAALRGGDPTGRIVALQIELALGGPSQEFTQMAASLASEVEDGPWPDAAGLAALEAAECLTAAGEKTREWVALSFLYRAALQRRVLMRSAIQHIRKEYRFEPGGGEDWVYFLTLSRELFIAYLHERDAFAWVGQLYFLETMLLENLADSWELFDVEGILLSAENSPFAKKVLVQLLAQARGRTKLEDFWNGKALASLDASLVDRAIRRVFETTKEEDLRALIVDLFPEVTDREF